MKQPAILYHLAPWLAWPLCSHQAVTVQVQRAVIFNLTSIVNNSAMAFQSLEQKIAMRNEVQ